MYVKQALSAKYETNSTADSIRLDLVNTPPVQNQDMYKVVLPCCTASVGVIEGNDRKDEVMRSGIRNKCIQKMGIC